MTQEEKQLLLKDLCARLPYNVKVAVDYKTYLELLPDDDEDSHYKEHFNMLLKVDGKTIEDVSLEPQIVCSYPCSGRFLTFRGCNDDYGIPVELIKPYLRPMLSMTEEEIKELYKILGFYYLIDNYEITDEWRNFKDSIKYNKLFLPYPIWNDDVEKGIDWLNAHHFDFRNLIDKGLAIDCTNLNIY